MGRAFEKALGSFEGAFWGNMLGMYRGVPIFESSGHVLLFWDDDFYQAYLLMESLVEGFSFKSFQSKLLKWYLDKPDGIGLTTFRTLSALSSGASPLEAVYISHKAMRGRSAGNGPMMRSFAIPVYLVCSGSDEKDAFEKLLKLNYLSSLATHFDPLAGLVASAYGAKFLENYYGKKFFRSFHELCPPEILDDIAPLFDDEKIFKEYRKLYENAPERFLYYLRLGFDPDHEAPRWRSRSGKPTAFSVHTYIVFQSVVSEMEKFSRSDYCDMEEKRDVFLRAVSKAISFGGDMDTQGEVVGAYFGFILGYIDGLGEIPDWDRVTSILRRMNCA